MERDDLVEADGEIIECFPNSLWTVRLENGHCLLGHVDSKIQLEANQFLLGARVRVQLRVFDLSVGRIVAHLRDGAVPAATT
jgi:translation initiation factor IF-1